MQDWGLPPQQVLHTPRVLAKCKLRLNRDDVVRILISLHGIAGMLMSVGNQAARKLAMQRGSLTVTSARRGGH